MAAHLTIASLANPRVKHVVRLRDRNHRDRHQQFIIEGYRELLRALESRYAVEELFICPDFFLGQNEDGLVALFQAAGTAIIETTPEVFRKMAYRDRPEGLLGVAPQRHCALARLVPGNKPLLLVAEAIEKPGNLGTILRSADATAADGLILCDQCTDLFNPNVVRASTGMLFSVPVAEATSEQALQWLKSLKVAVLAATPHADCGYTDVDMTVPLAIVIGAEQYGLSRQWLDHADIQVKIPMLGKADSLNVATATTLLLYEALRQRRSKPSLPR